MVRMREDVNFSSSGETCTAWLYPAGGEFGRRPIVVMAIGVTGSCTCTRASAVPPEFI